MAVFTHHSANEGLRILNPSFAEWCVKTAKEMINYIKEAYQKNLSKVEYKVNDKR